MFFQDWNSPKLLVGIANREDSDQIDLDLHCLSKPFWQTTSVGNLRTFTVHVSNIVLTSQ